MVSRWHWGVVCVGVALSALPGCGDTGDGGGPDGAVDGRHDGGSPGDDAGNSVCDPEVVPETTCGGVTCAPLGEAADTFCAVTCCTEDGRCGATVAFRGGAAAPCIPEPQPDPDCPGVEGRFGPVTGCCAGQECGLVTFGRCLARSELNALGGREEPLPLLDCDGEPIAGADAGMKDADAGL